MISPLIVNKEVGAALFVLAVILFGAGYTTSEVKQSQVEEHEYFDPFDYKVVHAVNPSMEYVINNPTEYNLLFTENQLKIEYTNWGKRQSEDNENYLQYLVECERIIDDIQAGETHTMPEVETLYSIYYP